MARSGVIRDTTQSLRRLLETNLPSRGDGPIRIVTDAPDRSTIAGLLPCVSLFLYRIEENRSLYRPEKILEPSAREAEDGVAVYRNPPIFLTMHHLVAAWGHTRDEEHSLLGQALGVLADHPRLGPENGLVGEAFGSGDRVLLRLTHPFGAGEQREILRSLGLDLRPVLSCSATARLDSERREAVRRVQFRSAGVVEKKR